MQGCGEVEHHGVGVRGRVSPSVKAHTEEGAGTGGALQAGHTCNLNTWTGEAGGSRIQGHAWPHSKFNQLGLHQTLSRVPTMTYFLHPGPTYSRFQHFPQKAPTAEEQAVSKS